MTDADLKALGGILHLSPAQRSREEVFSRLAQLIALNDYAEHRRSCAIYHLSGEGSCTCGYDTVARIESFRAELNAETHPRYMDWGHQLYRQLLSAMPEGE